MDATPRTRQPRSRHGRQPRIAIIGAGMSGIAAVVKLRQAGYTDLTVYEKTHAVGGTWRENRYPGLSCDVPSYLYQFSFALNPDWNHRFSCGPEIQAYMQDTAERFGVTPLVRFNTTVTELRYQAACKGLVFCSSFYPAISRDNAQVVTAGIERIEASGLRDAAGLPELSGRGLSNKTVSADSATGVPRIEARRSPR